MRIRSPILPIAACLTMLMTGCSPTAEIDSGNTSVDTIPSLPDSGVDDDVASVDAAPVPDKKLTDVVLMFHFNLQEYGYLDESASATTRALDLFKSAGLPVDVYITTWMVDGFEAKHPALLNRLLTDNSISLNYHIRAPKPYRVNFKDWYGLKEMTSTEQVAEIKNFESYGLALDTGLATAEEGGFAKLKRLYGRSPFVGGIASDMELRQSVYTAFSEMGLKYVIEHGRLTTIGDTAGPFFLKPEAIGVKAFQFDATQDKDTCLSHENGADLYDCEVARCADLDIHPCTVAIKVHV
jgi:hypothetical protein